jgi:hypothetical protein
MHSTIEQQSQRKLSLQATFNHLHLCCMMCMYSALAVLACGRHMLMLVVLRTNAPMQLCH